MPEPPPVIVTSLLPAVHQELISLLGSFSPDEWAATTSCPGWSVKDIALHLLGVEVGVLSNGRDKMPGTWFSNVPWDELEELVNRQNELWVEAARRLSTNLLCDLLLSLGRQTCTYFESVDLHALGPSVNWAGNGPAPMWLHVAREYTERWYHQQQIREALDRQLLTQPEFFSPVLATFVRGLPRAFEGVDAPNRTVVQVAIQGESGNTWHLGRDVSGWALNEGAADAAAEVAMEERDAWKIFTKGIDINEVKPRVKLSGDESLGLTVLRTVAIIA